MSQHDNIDRLLAERDELGIVTAARERRETYANFIDRRVAAQLIKPSMKATIAKMVDARLKAEIEGIIARRTAKAAKEFEASSLPLGPNIATVLRVVSVIRNVPIAELLGPRRSRPHARARQIIYHILRRTRPDLSLPAIGMAIGKRDHTTVIAGIRRAEMLMDSDPAWKHDYDAAMEAINGEASKL